MADAARSTSQLSEAQERALRAAADGTLRLAGRDAWIVTGMGLGDNVRQPTLAALEKRGLLVIDHAAVRSRSVAFGRAHRPTVTDAGLAALGHQEALDAE